MAEIPRNQIIQGDSKDVLSDYPNDSVDLVITSPPYYNQRDYDVDGQIGGEGALKRLNRKIRLRSAFQLFIICLNTGVQLPQAFSGGVSSNSGYGAKKSRKESEQVC